MYETLFANQLALEDADLVRYAQAVGLDPEEFRRALDSHAFAERVQEDVESGQRSGVFGTPTFFVNGVHHWGVYKSDALLAAVEQALGSGEPPDPTVAADEATEAS
jgi:2-hydroxychromene-2-carboxylate isomerase